MSLLSLALREEKKQTPFLANKAYHTKRMTLGKRPDEDTP
jgi:hypothetical protein